MRVKIRDNISTFYQRAERFMQIHRVLENLKDVLSVEIEEKKVEKQEPKKPTSRTKKQVK